MFRSVTTCVLLNKLTLKSQKELESRCHAILSRRILGLTCAELAGLINVRNPRGRKCPLTITRQPGGRFPAGYPQGGHLPCVRYCSRFVPLEQSSQGALRTALIAISIHDPGSVSHRPILL